MHSNLCVLANQWMFGWREQAHCKIVHRCSWHFQIIISVLVCVLSLGLCSQSWIVWLIFTIREQYIAAIVATFQPWFVRISMRRIFMRLRMLQSCGLFMAITRIHRLCEVSLHAAIFSLVPARWILMHLWVQVCQCHSRSKSCWCHRLFPRTCQRNGAHVGHRFQPFYHSRSNHLCPWCSVHLFCHHCQMNQNSSRHLLDRLVSPHANSQKRPERLHRLLGLLHRTCQGANIEHTEKMRSPNAWPLCNREQSRLSFSRVSWWTAHDGDVLSCHLCSDATCKGYADHRIVLAGLTGRSVLIGKNIATSKIVHRCSWHFQIVLSVLICVLSLVMSCNI